MIRVTTLYAGSATTTARYYTKYLTKAPGEEPGSWLGDQAADLGLAGVVSTEALELLLSGRDPITGTGLGYPLSDRVLANGKVIKAVAGFDATVSAPLCRIRHAVADAQFYGQGPDRIGGVPEQAHNVPNLSRRSPRDQLVARDQLEFAP